AGLQRVIAAIADGAPHVQRGKLRSPELERLRDPIHGRTGGNAVPVSLEEFRGHVDSTFAAEQLIHVLRSGRSRRGCPRRTGKAVVLKGRESCRAGRAREEMLKVRNRLHVLYGRGI